MVQRESRLTEIRQNKICDGPEDMEQVLEETKTNSSGSE